VPLGDIFELAVTISHRQILVSELTAYLPDITAGPQGNNEQEPSNRNIAPRLPYTSAGIGGFVPGTTARISIGPEPIWI
jgi:hypothetical protein